MKEIINILDKITRKVMKGSNEKWIIFMLIVIAFLLWIAFSWDVEVIEKVQWHQMEVKKPVEVKKVAVKWDVAERAFKLIVKYEGFHDKPYWDYKQWSCGYWMKCNKNTKNITKEKSKKFVMERIDHIRIKHKLHNIDDSIEVALISFTYNIWHPPIWYRWYIKHWYINWLKNRFKEYSYAGWKFLRGLYKRRVDESSFNN